MVVCRCIHMACASVYFCRVIACSDSKDSVVASYSRANRITIFALSPFSKLWCISLFSFAYFQVPGVILLAHLSDVLPKVLSKRYLVLHPQNNEYLLHCLAGVQWMPDGALLQQ